ncbi:MAG: PPC domain-containing DNA-binding protein [Flavisolibacter sp.]
MQNSSAMLHTYAIRLQPGQDLKKEIQNFVHAKNIEAGWIVTALGSLTDYHMRFANQNSGQKASGHFEILSLSGTLSIHGSHIHICIADKEGKTIGGHLLDDNIIYTTAEIIIQQSGEHIFQRETGTNTSFKELVIIEK